MFEYTTILIGGILAGTLGGLLGIGGGVILMPVLIFFAGLSPACAAGTCVTAVFFTTLGGVYRHFKLGNIDFKSIYPVICVFRLVITTDSALNLPAIPFFTYH